MISFNFTMTRIGIVVDDDFATKNESSYPHPIFLSYESPLRIQSILAYLEKEKIFDDNRGRLWIGAGSERFFTLLRQEGESNDPFGRQSFSKRHTATHGHDKASDRIGYPMGNRFFRYLQNHTAINKNI